MTETDRFSVQETRKTKRTKWKSIEILYGSIGRFELESFQNFFVVLIAKSLILRIKKVNHFSNFSKKNAGESFGI